MSDCKTCKHYVANSSFATPACNKLQMLLGTHTQKDNPQLREQFSSLCGSYEAGPSVTTNLQVGAVHVGANPDGLSTAMTQAPSREAPVSCSQCKYYIAPKTVMAEHGWMHGMCEARGDLLLGGSLQMAAQACPFGDVGPGPSTTANVTLDKYYTGGLNGVRTGGPAPKYARGFDPLRHIQTDPREWETDKPLSPEDIEDGVIRAWRRVDDPKGKMPPKYMPVFDWKALGIERDPRETYGEHTPHLYEDHAGLLYWFAFLYGGQWCDTDAGEVGLKETLMLIGEAGTGKTEFWCYVAWLMDLPFVRLSLRPDTESLEFFGTGALVDSESGSGQVTVFKPARFSIHVQKPGIICLDELSAAPDPIMYLIRPVIDGASQLVIEQENWIADKDPACFIGATTNPHWNPLYTGARQFSAADDDRLTKRYVQLPDEDTERRIITSHCKAVGYDIDKTTLDRLFRIAGELREQYRLGDSTLPWGIRSQVKVARLTWGLDTIDAFRTAVLDGMDPDQAEMILAVVQAHS